MRTAKTLLPVLGVVLWIGAAQLRAQEEPPEETQYREDYERYQKIREVKDPMRRADELIRFLRERTRSRLEPNVATDMLYILQDLDKASKWDTIVAQAGRLIQVRPRIGETYYFLGRALKEQGKVPEAMDALAKCYVIKNPVSSKAKQFLDYIYKGARGNLNGLDALIQKARADIGQ